MTSTSDSKPLSSDAGQVTSISQGKPQDPVKKYQEELYAYTLSKLNQAKDDSKKPNTVGKAYLSGLKGEGISAKNSKKTSASTAKT